MSCFFQLNLSPEICYPINLFQKAKMQWAPYIRLWQDEARKASIVVLVTFKKYVSIPEVIN